MYIYDEYINEKDKPELVNCELCQVDKDIKDCEKFIGYWVCDKCVQEHREENESVIKSLMKWRREVDRRKKRNERQLAMMDWNELIITIERDLKPFVKATNH